MGAFSVLFAGTPQFAAPALEALFASRHRVLAVYTQPDRPAGRGQQLAISPIKACALAHGAPVLQPASLRDPQVLDELRAWSADLLIVAAYGLILPAAVLAAPRLSCLNIHASLLPRWRGAAPIQRALLAGDEASGVTIMQMDAGLDTGPMLLKRETALEADDTSATLQDRLALLGAQALLDALDQLATGTLQPRPQPAEGVTYAAKINKHEALIEWSKPAVDRERQVRAFNPWPIAETRWKGQQLRIWQAEVVDVDAAAPGTVVQSIPEGIDVATGAQGLRIKRLQSPGRKAVSAAEFVRAHDLRGVVFGA